MKQPKISIIVVHYNTPQYLKSCLKSISAQTYKNIDVTVIDNNSENKGQVEFDIENKENLGYARAANQGIRLALAKKADYIAITNPDIIYTPAYFEELIPQIQKNPKIASITGKIYKYDFKNNKKTKIIDTTGLAMLKNRRFIDIGQGEQDKGQFETEKEIFGVSGACPLYRSKALKDTKILNEYFDEDFFMYKEDVDLAWRLQLYGWKSLYYPKAIAYHGRGTGTSLKSTTKQALKNRKTLTKFQKKHSFTNQKLMQTKNETFSSFTKNFFPIMLTKILTPFYITLKEPYLWGAYINYFKKLPKILKKRKIVMKHCVYRRR